MECTTLLVEIILPKLTSKSSDSLCMNIDKLCKIFRYTQAKEAYARFGLIRFLFSNDIFAESCKIVNPELFPITRLLSCVTPYSIPSNFSFLFEYALYVPFQSEDTQFKR